MAVVMTIAQFLSLLVSGFIAYSIVKSGASVLRIVLSVTLGFIMGWASVFFVGWLFGSIKNVSPDTVLRLLGTTFWMSTFGAIGGAYYGRKKLKSFEASKNGHFGIPPEARLATHGVSYPSTYGTSAPERLMADDSIYAAIAKEFEAGALDSGLWTRLYAECDGDEPKTKAAYIRNRAAKLSAANSGGIPSRQPSKSGQNSADDDRIPSDKKVGFAIIGAIVLGLIVVVSQMGKPKISLIDADESFPAKGAHCQKHSDCPAGPPAQMCNLQTKRCYMLERQLY